jgi:hypothetical protein
MSNRHDNPQPNSDGSWGEHRMLIMHEIKWLQEQLGQVEKTCTKCRTDFEKRLTEAEKQTMKLDIKQGMLITGIAAIPSLIAVVVSVLAFLR